MASANEGARTQINEDATVSGRTDYAAAWEAVDAAREALRAAQITPEGITAEVVRAATSTPEFQAAAQLTGMQNTDWVGEWQRGGFPALMGGFSYDGLFGDMKAQLEEMAGEAADAAEEAGEEIGDELSEGAEGASDLSGAGENAASTFVNAIQGWFAAAYTAGAGLAGQFAQGVSDGLGIASPSRVMREMGLFTAEGFALGVEDGLERVDAAVGSMTDATIGAGSGVSGGMGLAGFAETVANAIRGMKVQIDGQDAGSVLAPTISDILGEQADSWRYDEV